MLREKSLFSCTSLFGVMLNLRAMLLRESLGPTCNKRGTCVLLHCTIQTTTSLLIRPYVFFFFKCAVAVVLLTMNSTVPGGLLFSLFAWFSLLQPLSTRQAEKEKRSLQSENNGKKNKTKHDHSSCYPSHTYCTLLTDIFY